MSLMQLTLVPVQSGEVRVGPGVRGDLVTLVHDIFDTLGLVLVVDTSTD